MNGFKINENKGFQITFDNGVTVSIQFGYGNYCDNRAIFTREPHTDGAQSETAEIAIWDKEGWITQQYDHELTDVVMGYVMPSEIPKILVWAEAYKGA